MSSGEELHVIEQEKLHLMEPAAECIALTRFDRIDWMTSEEPLWAIPEHLVGISHTPIFQPTRRMYMDERLYKAGLIGRAE